MSFSGHVDRLNETVMRHLADTVSATYTPITGAPVTGLSVIVDQDVERAVPSMNGNVIEYRTELTGYSTELSGARRGDTVTVGADVWKLVSRLKDDGTFVTWIVS